MGKGKATAGLVLTIMGVVLGLTGGMTAFAAVCGLPISIVGLVLSVVGGKQLKTAGQPSGMATAGLVLGIIAVVFTTITFFTCGLCVIFASTASGVADDILGLMI